MVSLVKKLLLLVIYINYYLSIYHTSFQIINTLLTHYIVIKMLEKIESVTTLMEIVGQEKYKKEKLTQIEDIKPKIDFEKSHVAVSKNGGLMAYVKKSDRILMDTNNIINKNIRVFSQTGKNEKIISVSSN